MVETEREHYQCEDCEHTVEQPKDKSAPVCCGKPMKHLPLEVCTQPATAEWSRPMEHEEPCDDSRAGK